MQQGYVDSSRNQARQNKPEKINDYRIGQVVQMQGQSASDLKPYVGLTSDLATLDPLSVE
jgi:hypothetical protein